MKFVLGFLAAVSIPTIVALAVPVHQNSLNVTDTPADVLIIDKEGGDAQADVFSLVHALSVHSHGVASLGTDGVLRSLSPNGTVLDYVKLQNDHIQTLIDHIGRDDELTEMYEGVDGHNVTDIDQILHPNKTYAGKRQEDDERKMPSGIDGMSHRVAILAR